MSLLVFYVLNLSVELSCLKRTLYTFYNPIRDLRIGQREEMH